jgi:hypothetical protein
MIKENSKNKKIKNKKKHHLTYFYSNMHEKSKDIYTIFEILRNVALSTINLILSLYMQTTRSVAVISMREPVHCLSYF